MNAEQFVKAFNFNIAEIEPTGFSGQWSRGMYTVIEQIGEEANFTVKDKKTGGEVNHLDFAFIPKSKKKNLDYDYPPAVVIEHENRYNVEETWKDFWKLCLYAVPLRVMIGYQRTDEEALTAGQELVQRYQGWNLRQIPSGETLLIMGWRQYPDERKWHMWLLKGEQDTWEYFQEVFL